MNLVGQIITLPPVEAFTSRNTPITIGNNKDKYKIISHLPSIFGSEVKGYYSVEYIKSSHKQQNFPKEVIFFIPDNIIHSALSRTTGK